MRKHTLQSTQKHLHLYFVLYEIVKMTLKVRPFVRVDYSFFNFFAKCSTKKLVI
jgi:hypothetical protein